MSKDASAFVTTIVGGQGANVVLEFKLAPAGVSSLIVKVETIAERRGCGDQESCHCRTLKEQIPNADDEAMTNIIRNYCPVRELISTGQHFLCEMKVGLDHNDMEQGVSLHAAPHILSKVVEDLSTGDIPAELLPFRPVFVDLNNQLAGKPSLVMVSPNGVRHFTADQAEVSDIDRLQMPSQTVH
ncbi:MAG: hypothetical protein ABJN42_13750 [Roseibium sp.]|uniref:hypothetical protein n=1 Tax=Roseibium sp. TaxID=1936156 RepID=UPI0032990EB6